MTGLSSHLLESYVGQHISTICLNGFDDDAHNHCAHFVAHVLGVGHGKTCRRMTHSSRHSQPGASILVSDLFDAAPECRELLECPSNGQGLVFVSAPVNFQQIGSDAWRIRSVRKRHVGLFHNGKVWHYSNHNRRVIRKPISQFIAHFPRQSNALWVSAVPGGSRPRPFGVSVGP